MEGTARTRQIVLRKSETSSRSRGGKGEAKPRRLQVCSFILESRKNWERISSEGMTRSVSWEEQLCSNVENALGLQ